MAHTVTATGTFTFGKHKGKSALDVFLTEPSYICWVKRSGYATLDAEVMEAITYWENENPKEVARVERGIARGTKTDKAKYASGGVVTPPPASVAKVAKSLLREPTTAATVKPPVEILICDEDDVLPPWHDSLENAFEATSKTTPPPSKAAEDPNWGTW